MVVVGGTKTRVSRLSLLFCLLLRAKQHVKQPYIRWKLSCTQSVVATATATQQPAQHQEQPADY